MVYIFIGVIASVIAGAILIGALDDPNPLQYLISIFVWILFTVSIQIFLYKNVDSIQLLYHNHGPNKKCEFCENARAKKQSEIDKKYQRLIRESESVIQEQKENNTEEYNHVPPRNINKETVNEENSN